MTECRGSIVAIIKLHAPSSSTSHFPSCVCVWCVLLFGCASAACVHVQHIFRVDTRAGVRCALLCPSACMHAQSLE